MTTPNKEKIRDLAQKMYQESNQHLPTITATTNELKECGIWNLARNDLMRNNTRSEQLSYCEELANEMGYRLVTKKDFANGITSKTQIEIVEGIVFDVEEAMRSGIFVSGTSQCGKSTLAMHIAKRLIEDNIIVFIIDPTQVWFKFNAIENTISINPLKQKQSINWNDQSTLFDTSRLNPFEQQKFIEAFCTQMMHVAINRTSRPKIIVVFEECHTPIYNGSMRSMKSQNTARLLTQGGNFDIRFIAITQFSAMVDKLVVKMAQQRYLGKTSEPNDLKYLNGIIGKHISELPYLKRGEFLYSHSGEVGKIQIKPLPKRMKCLE